VGLSLRFAPAGRRVVVPPGVPVVIGREVSCDLPVVDPEVSRRHAELSADADGLRVRDLGSRNGTFVNGVQITDALLMSGDMLSVGGVELLVIEDEAPAVIPPGSGERSTSPRMRSDTVDGPFVINERAASGIRAAVDNMAARRLAQLVEIARRLGGTMAVDALLDTIARDLCETVDADRVAVLLSTRGVDGKPGPLEARLSHTRDGAATAADVPQSIARRVAEARVAVLTHDAPADDRFEGLSVTLQSVRSALCAPLIDSRGDVLGVLYADNRRVAGRFNDGDLDFLVAFAGVAAAAVEREQAADQLRAMQRMRENFERYFTPTLAARIADADAAHLLEGERRRVVVLFADIRGFTRIAESLAPDALAAQLNEYFDAMVECVFRHEGALDKFIGDSLLAYWGAPVAYLDDADRALEAVRDMQQTLAVLNERWATAGRPTLGVGIGLNAGDAFVGNIGSPRRLEYTLIGDTVNVANRLCGAAAPNEVLVSEAFRALCQLPQEVTPRPDVTLRNVTSDVQVLALTLSHRRA
jgi:adenylate cyclase